MAKKNSFPESRGSFTNDIIVTQNCSGNIIQNKYDKNAYLGLRKRLHSSSDSVPFQLTMNKMKQSALENI